MKGEEEDIEAPAAKAAKPPNFPWRPTLNDRIFQFLLSDAFRTGFQLGVGVFGVALFALVPRMRFSQACLAATLYLVCSLLISQSNTLGDRFLGCVGLIGPAWLGAISAGCAVSIARATHTHFTVFLSVFGVLGLLIFSTVRAGSNPAVAMPNGIAGTVVYGVSILQSQFVHPLRNVWQVVIAHLILDAVIAGVATAVSGALILPSLAGDDLRFNIAAALRGAGQALSGYATVIFAPDAHEMAIMRQSTMRTLKSVLDENAPEELTDMAFFEELEEATKPRRERGSVLGPGGVPAASLRPLLGNARLKLHAVECEPSWLQNNHIYVNDWASLITAVETLLMRAAALESLLEGRSQHLRSAFFAKYFGVDLLPNFRIVYGLIAVACAKLAWAVQAHRKNTEIRMKVLFGDQWPLLKRVLTEDIAMALDSYWDRVRREEEQGITISPAAEMRALLFVTILTSGIVDSMEALEKAVEKALGMSQPGASPPSEGKLDVGASRRTLRAAYTTAAQNGATKAPNTEPASTPQMTGPMEHISLDVKPPQMDGSSSAAAQKPESRRQQRLRLLKCHTAWLRTLLPSLCCVPIFKQCWKVYRHDLPKALSSRGALHKALHDKFFQFWLKFWGCCAVVMVLIIALSRDRGNVREYYPFYGFLSVPIVMSERVEMTISKGVLRIGGTAIGGTIGYLVMLNSRLATDPYLLMLIVVAATFCFGFGGRTQYMYAILLTLISLNALVLCQVIKFPCLFCDAHGSAHYYAARVLSISLGCLAPMLVSNLIMPWFASGTALVTLANAYQSCVDLFEDYYEHIYRLTAHAAGVGADKEVPPFSASALQDRVARPLSMVQIALAKESVLWKRGWYTFPPAVARTLVELQDLLNRMAALDVVVKQPPNISGAYTGATYRVFLEPTKKEFKAMVVSMRAMVAAAGSVLRGDGQSGCAELIGRIQALEATRAQLRAVYLRQRGELHHAVKNATHMTDILNHDDSARFLAFTWTFVKAVDKAEAVAKSLLVDECKKRDSIWAWLK